MAFASVEMSSRTFDTDRHTKQRAFMNAVVSRSVRISSWAPVGDGWDEEGLLEHYVGYAVGSFLSHESFLRVGSHDGWWGDCSRLTLRDKLRNWKSLNFFFRTREWRWVFIRQGVDVRLPLLLLPGTITFQCWRKDRRIASWRLTMRAGAQMGEKKNPWLKGGRMELRQRFCVALIAWTLSEELRSARNAVDGQWRATSAGDVTIERWTLMRKSSLGDVR